MAWKSWKLLYNYNTFLIYHLLPSWTKIVKYLNVESELQLHPPPFFFPILVTTDATFFIFETSFLKILTLTCPLGGGILAWTGSGFFGLYWASMVLTSVDSVSKWRETKALFTNRAKTEEERKFSGSKQGIREILWGKQTWKWQYIAEGMTNAVRRFHTNTVWTWILNSLKEWKILMWSELV